MPGQVMGSILNIILDPVLILLFDWGIASAAIDTVIGNALGACYYILYYHYFFTGGLLGGYEEKRQLYSQHFIDYFSCALRKMVRM